MRRLLFVFVALAALASPTVALADGSQTQSQAAQFTANITGDQQVPAKTTAATGRAVFSLSDDGLTLSYHIEVTNISGVVASHIHLGAPGINGPVVGPFVFTPPPPGPFTGVLAEGTITRSNLTGPLQGHPLSDLIAAMENDGAYVNIHTRANPGGEIRGLITGDFQGQGE